MVKIKLEDTVERCVNHPFQKVLDETVIVDTHTRLMHALDDVGSHLWSLLVQPCKVEEIIKQVTESYDVPARQAETDIVQFLERMRDCGLIKVK